MRFPFNIIGRQVSPEVHCREQDSSVILTEGGFAVMNPNKEWATREMVDYLRLKGECWLLDDGLVQISVFDPPEDEYPLYSLYIMPFTFLPPEFIAWLQENVPLWEQPADFAKVSLQPPSGLSAPQHHILSQLPAAYGKLQEELAERPSGFPVLRPAPPKRGIVGFGTAL